MGKLIKIPGQTIMLIRNCECGGKPELRNGMSKYYEDAYEVSIKCSKCGKELHTPYYNKHNKGVMTARLIKEWNRR